MKDMNLYNALEKERTKKRLKTLFFASFAHDLMTPINVIMAMSEETIAYTENQPVIHDMLQISRINILTLYY